MKKYLSLLVLFFCFSGFSQSQKTAKFIRNNWNDFIIVKTNKFSYSKTSGIKDLQIIVLNKTKYKIDSVEIIVCYKDMQEDCLKKFDIDIQNIPANSSKMIAAPNSKRGVKISTMVMGIGSKQMNFGYAPGNWGKELEDPYYSVQ